MPASPTHVPLPNGDWKVAARGKGRRISPWTVLIAFGVIAALIAQVAFFYILYSLLRPPPISPELRVFIDISDKNVRMRFYFYDQFDSPLAYGNLTSQIENSNGTIIWNDSSEIDALYHYFSYINWTDMDPTPYRGEELLLKSWFLWMGDHDPYYTDATFTRP